MMNMIPIALEDGVSAIGIEVKLPKTTLLVVTTDKGYIMCGALDVGLLNERLADRGIIAGRAVGVRTIGELLEGPLESVTIAAEALGIVPGMIGKDAVKIMATA
ncbi:YunC family protein [Paenibacillus sp. GCM10027626]|uniref:YunC family protein n=1 Tax=Paenibacillus sp. GCM10027626 TaxID=3273411 RepID=UPI00362B6A60